MTSRLIIGLILLAAGAIWGVVALTRGGDIVMPGIMIVSGGMLVAVEVARRRPDGLGD